MSEPATILVVDDEPYMIRLLQHHIERAGHRMIKAVNGREALDRIRTQQPRLVLMDVMMPEINGLEVLAQIRREEATKHLPVIIMTANAQRFTREEAEAAGVTAFLTKPFSPTQLMAEVNRQLGPAAKG
ncbi:MAG TPA: two-component system response regulator [Verrucomicrobiales bacterium]|nr:two-component system response regulator [Verrucomicrobiales bacterium]